MSRSIHKQLPEREEVESELREAICDFCHYTYILPEDKLPEQCGECPVMEKIGELIRGL